MRARHAWLADLQRRACQMTGHKTDRSCQVCSAKLLEATLENLELAVSVGVQFPQLWDVSWETA